MDRLTFTGGAYSTRSPIGDKQECINYYPEFNLKGSPSPLTSYQRPGFRPVASLNAGGVVRCLYRASNGVVYAVIGPKLYVLDAYTVTLQELGTFYEATRTNFCYAIDNGTYMLVVDGSTTGLKVTLADNTTVQIGPYSADEFYGADRVDYIDSFFIGNRPGTNQFWSTESGGAFNGTYLGSKNGYPDNIQTLIVNRREILLVGGLKSEMWYDAGNPTFPFAELSGAYTEHGTVAKYSIASSDISMFWLGQDLQGQGIVFRQRGYDCKRISNYGVEQAIRKIAQKTTIADAIGYTYQQNGHVFYVLTFPSGDQTWVFDDSISIPELAWHQRGWMDANGILHRDRSNCACFGYGKNLVGDWENGTIYELDLDEYSDLVSEIESPIYCLRTFPHLMRGLASNGQLVEGNGRIIKHTAFWLDCEPGGDPTQDVGPQLTLRYSDNRGKTWGNGVLQSAGKLGEFNVMPTWRMLGQSRFRLYEISHRVPGPLALNGAWVNSHVEQENQ
jgi:hypothetical protein